MTYEKVYPLDNWAANVKTMGREEAEKVYRSECALIAKRNAVADLAKHCETFAEVTEVIVWLLEARASKTKE
jgi:hypothetical protein